MSKKHFSEILFIMRVLTFVTITLEEAFSRG